MANEYAMELAPAIQIGPGTVRYHQIVGCMMEMLTDDRAAVLAERAAPTPRRSASGRAWEVGHGFVRAKECPDCLHTRCSEECVCNCDAARAEAEAAFWRGRVEAIERDRLAPVQEADALRAERDQLSKLVNTLAALPVQTCDGCGLQLRLAVSVQASLLRATQPPAPPVGTGGAKGTP